MLEGEKKKKHGKCVDCGGPTELYEWDVKKGIRILRCQRCGFLHYYKKDILGWKLIRASRAEQSKTQG